LPCSSGPEVHVAVVNWNTARAALGAAAAYRRSDGVQARVTIIDNDSEPADQALLRAGVGEDIELRIQAANHGYGAAANCALAGTDAQLVCVSNADVTPAPEMLARLSEVAVGDRSIGLAAPCLGGARGYHAQLPKGWVLPARAFVARFGYRAIPDPPAGAIAEVEQPAGACILARTEVWRALGGFDPSFFLWFEDVDLARRSRAAGYRNVVVGDAIAAHVGAEAFARLDERTRQRIRLDSLDRYAAKHHASVYGVTRLAIALATPLRARDAGAGAGDRPRTPQQPSDLEQL
jgi:N-acetylglucosaminyl-diphospho-decaprenol L-rhamnosyltransferase